MGSVSHTEIGMSKSKIILLLGSLFFIIIVLGTVFYTESNNIQSQNTTIRKIVQNDLQVVETFLNGSSEMKNWVTYLNLAEFKSTLNTDSEKAHTVQNLLLTKLRNAYGIEKYPPLCALRDSLSTLHSAQKVSVFQTIFQKITPAEQFIITRQQNPVSSPTQTLLAAAQAMQPESISELEENFYAQSAAELPFPVTDIFTQESRDMQDFPKVETIVQNTDTDVIKNTVKTVSKNTRRPPLAVVANRFAKKSAMESTMESKTISKKLEDIETTENNSLAQSSVTITTTEVATNDSVEESMPELFEDDACLPAEVAVQSPKMQTTAPSIALENAIPEIAVTSPKTEQGQEVTTPISSENEAIQEQKPEKKTSADTDEELFIAAGLPTLPTLHFSLEEAVNQASANISISDSHSETMSDETPISLCGNFTQDVVTVQNAWKHIAYQLPVETDLENAYAEVCESGRRIEKLLTKTTEKKRREWKDFLLWNTLNFDAPADSVALKEVYDRLNSGAFGLELEFFVEMREAIARYLALEAQILSGHATEELYKSAQIRMIALLTLAQQKNTSEVQRAIEDLAEWFVVMGQVSEPLLATYQIWSKPNMTANVSASVFERFGSQFIEEEQEVREQLQRATIRGKALFSGNLSVEPIFNEKQIELGIFLEGGVDSKTRAYQGPAIVSARARSRVEVQKCILIDESGFNATAAKVKMRTNSRIENVQDIHNRHLLESLIARRVFAKKDETEQLANAQSTLRMRQRFDEMLDPILNDWNQRFTDLFLRQFEPRGLVSESTRTWSDDCGIHAYTSMTCREGFAAPSDAPQFPQACDIQLTLHESAFQQIAKGFLGGLNLNTCAREQFVKSLPEWLNPGNNSEEAENDENAPQDWTLRFPHTWPISVSFEEGKVTFCMHCDKMEYDGKEYPALNIIAIYAIETRNQQIMLVRQGNIEIFPPDFNPAVKKRLPSSMVSLRRVMSKRLQNVFTKEILLNARPVVKNPDDSQSRFAHLYIQPVVLHAENGWLQIGFNLENRQPPCPQAE